MDNKIMFTTDNGENVEFTVIEEARLSGETYLLVTADERMRTRSLMSLKKLKQKIRQRHPIKW